MTSPASNDNPSNPLAGFDELTRALRNQAYSQAIAEVDGLYSWKVAHLRTVCKGADLAARLAALSAEKKAYQKSLARMRTGKVGQERKALKKDIMGKRYKVRRRLRSKDSDDPK